jgi:multiple sugar transport system permease protein
MTTHLPRRAGAPPARSWLRALEPLAYVSPALLLVSVTLLLPLAIGVYYSFVYYSLSEPWQRGFAGGANYLKAFGDPVFLRSLQNTLLWVFASLALQLGLGLGLALLLRRPFWGKRVYQSLIFVPWAVPAFLVAMMWKWLLNPTISPLPALMGNLAGGPAVDLLSDPRFSLWGPIAANVWFGVPFFAITLLAALTAIPGEYYEAANIDGASVWQQFSRITLPFLAPTIAITVLLRTIWIANFPDLIYIMTEGGPAGSSQIVSSYILTVTIFKTDYGYAAAIAMILLLLLVAYALLVLRLRARWEQ